MSTFKRNLSMGGCPRCARRATMSYFWKLLASIGDVFLCLVGKGA